MFRQRDLFESRPRRVRPRGAALISTVVHLALIGSAVVLTVEEPQAAKPDAPPPLIYVTPAEPAAPIARSEPVPPADPTAPSPLPAAAVVVPPLDIPTSLPPLPEPGSLVVDRIPSDAPAIGTRGTSAGPRSAHGIEDGSALRADIVERPVVPIGTMRAPHYPEMLRRDRVEGEVLATFVVDTLGRVEPASFRAVSATHPLFVLAVKSSVQNMRFRAAESGGRRVRQLVEQRYVFALTR
ncbi:MAG: TonB family protein [Gemmatimonadaceae bacterium]